MATTRTDRTGSRERPTLGVGQLIAGLKGLLEQQVGRVWVVGEISNLQPLAELLERQLERADPARFETAHDQLQVAPRRVDRDLGLRDDLEALFQTEADVPRVAAEERAAHLPVFVLEREVGVTGAGLVEVADLPDDEHATDLLFEQPLEAGDQLADAEDRTFPRLGRSHARRHA